MQDDPLPDLRQTAARIIARLAPSEREGLLIKNWMSHDARWFMAVAGEAGLEAANRLNRRAARETGTAEARRIVRALQLPAPNTLDDYLLVQEVLIALLGPDLLDYRLRKVSDTAFELSIAHCFAYDNAQRAGIAHQYACGILARVAGWLDALDLAHEITPPVGACRTTTGGPCVHQIRLVLPG